MRILVTGANGQVGHELLRALAAGPHPPHPSFASEGGREAARVVLGPPPSAGRGPREARGDAHLLSKEGGRAAGAGGCASCEILPATRDGALADGAPCERIDLADLDALAPALDRIAPDLILNAAAYTAVDRAEDEPETAQRINADAVGALGAWARRHGARVVHYSTDYVFDGNASRPYRENDATHPIGAYGRSKLAGEIALSDSGARHLVFRTAWVYAARGHNFLRTMLRLGGERDRLRVVDDQIGAPTPARLIAETTLQVVTKWGDDTTSTRDGVYHLVASGQTSWCGFARAIFERARAKGLLERVPAVEAIRTADYPTKAARPAWSVLDTTKLRETFDIALPDWQHGLDEVIGELAVTR